MNNQSYAGMLRNLERIQLNQCHCYRLQNSVQSDVIGNLVQSYSKGYKASETALQETRERILEHKFNTDNTLQHIVTTSFNERVQEYISYLVANKIDLNYAEEIADLLVEFPHLSPLFESEEE